MIQFKIITYAYPTSDEATKRGFRKTGCYSFSLVSKNSLFYSDNDIQHVISRKTKEEILKDAQEFNSPWSDFSLFDHKGKSSADRILASNF